MINNINATKFIPLDVGFLIYEYCDFGAIKLDKITNIEWHNVNDFLRLVINNICVYEIYSKDNVFYNIEISYFKLTIIQRILLHIRTSINENIYINDIIKELIEK